MVHQEATSFMTLFSVSSRGLVALLTRSLYMDAMVGGLSDVLVYMHIYL
jgi:hypothetical protein